MPLCLCLPTCAVPVFFLFVGPCRTCPLSCVLFCVFPFHHCSGVVSSAFLSLAVSATFVALHVVSLSCHFFGWVPCRCSAHHAWPDCCQRFHPPVEGSVRAAQYLCHVLYVSCACFMRCCTHGADFPFSDMQVPTYVSFSAVATIASPAWGHGSRALCVELQFVFAWRISRPIILNPSVRSKNHVFQSFL